MSHPGFDPLRLSLTHPKACVLTKCLCQNPDSLVNFQNPFKNGYNATIGWLAHLPEGYLRILIEKARKKKKKMIPKKP